MTREVSISTRTAIDDLMSEEKVLKEERPTYGVGFAKWEIFGKGAAWLFRSAGRTMMPSAR